VRVTSASTEPVGGLLLATADLRGVSVKRPFDG
jgi:hypothetical protein